MNYLLVLVRKYIDCILHGFSSKKYIRILTALLKCINHFIRNLFVDNLSENQPKAIANFYTKLNGYQVSVVKLCSNVNVSYKLYLKYLYPQITGHITDRLDLNPHY